MQANDKRRHNRPHRKHRGHPGAPPPQKLTPEGKRRRIEWLRDHTAKLANLEFAERNG